MPPIIPVIGLNKPPPPPPLIPPIIPVIGLNKPPSPPPLIPPIIPVIGLNKPPSPPPLIPPIMPVMGLNKPPLLPPTMLVTVFKGLLSISLVILLIVFVTVVGERIFVIVESERGARAEVLADEVLLSIRLEVILFMGERRLLNSIILPIFLKLCCCDSII
ncbi:hypothetical protein L313_2295 [Acinetobacter haemolyticus CIP 64.3 = MTCC 9819]|nr:hypothetical protein L313_2295 [Acinetobacter haemolyticus CIP 64.3 = MTCC 9819]